MTLLALDTSSSYGTVALLDGRTVRAVVEGPVDRHETSLLGRIDTALGIAGIAKRDLSGVAVGTGPGGFTAVRMGIATAKGLALALSVPIVGVSSLAALARTVAPGSGLVATVVDAHRGEVFAALYFIEGEGTTELCAPLLATPEAAIDALLRAAAGMRMILAGDGLRVHREMAQGLDVVALPDACISAAALGLEAERRLRVPAADDLETLVPAYVRSADAKLPAQRLIVPT